MIAPPVALLAATTSPMTPTAPVPAYLREAGDLLGSLLERIENRHVEAHQGVVRELAALAGTAPKPADMLRLQAAVGEFTVRVQLSVRIAEELSRSVQTLTQRT